MLKNLADTTDLKYRRFIMKYIYGYHCDLIKDEEKRLFQSNLVHFGRMSLMGSPNNNRLKYRPSPDAGVYEKRFLLSDIDVSAWGYDQRHDAWAYIGWVNLNFKSPKMKKAFEVYVVNRILREKGDLVFKNACPTCARLRRTPYAKKCMWCMNLSMLEKF